MADVEFLEEKQAEKIFADKSASQGNPSSFFAKLLIRLGIVKTKRAGVILLTFLCISTIVFAIFLYYQNKTPTHTKEIMKYGAVDQTIFKNQSGI